MINNFKTFGMIITNFSNENFNRVIKNFEKLTINENVEIVFLINNEDNRNFENFSHLVEKSSLKNYLILNTFQNLEQSNAEWLILANSVGENVYLIDESVSNISEISKKILNIKNDDIVIIRGSSKTKLSISNKVFLFFIKIFFKNGKKISDIQKINQSIKIISRSIINQFSNTVNPTLYLQKEIFLNLDNEKVITLKVENSKNFSTGRKNIFNNTSAILFNSFMPMRIVSTFSLFLSFLCLIYSFWILFIFSKNDFLEGWVSTNLVLTLFFFMISVILFFLSEYFILQYKTNQINLDIKKERVKRDFLDNYDLNLKQFNNESKTS